ncbi:sodium/potassium-transporting ATPase subunit beta-1-interacting protein isoform X2 [Stomoxys calcitrans]|uniref:Sodium/potassium-transporting ATPase subunit beta-1-interacting protein n=1 Tax=Stomoxys calcitrans TaxID=35570 RepID=A0A1I8PPW4_STOCA|nr:sodium/potassium-transporting ATPase subunit beta-1-interacting protein isoform X2 [Stomoxys calcitrans]
MGSCTRRHFLLSTCFLQMITIIERQVFDFLGYMWAPIFVNFFHILFIIFGFYGAYHFRIKYIITYLIWNFLWIGWNSFLICFYLNVGTLDRDSDLLNLGTGSYSWFEVNGYGCKATYNTNITSEDPFRPLRPERVDDCLLTYDIVEVVHSGVQCILAFFGILGAILISYIFLDEDDRLKHVNKKSKHRQSLYSIEFGPSLDTLRSRTDTILDYGDDQMHEREGDNGELSPKPMTPRRVKRRSVMHRGSNSRTSTNSRRSHRDGGGGGSTSGGSHGGSHRNVASLGHSGTHSRSSTRSSRRKYQQNPVTKLLDQQQQQQHLPSSSSHGHKHTQHQFGSFHHKDNSSLTASNLQNLNKELHNNINVAGGSLTKTNNNHYQSFRKNIPPDPIYYNTNAQTGLYQQQQHMHADQLPPPWPHSTPSPIDEPQSPTLTISPSLGGHYNPTYQHSTTNLNDGEHVDELYNNRPPSVRSSYSNFHGTRPMSSYVTSSATTENVFASLVTANTATNAATSIYHQQQQQQFQQQQQQQQQLHQHEPPSTPPLYQQHPLHSTQQHSISSHNLPPPPPPPVPELPYVASQPQAIPFHKRTASRESIRSMAFLNSGPPAYNLNYHTPPDSETTM